MQKRFEMIAKTFQGLEDVLAQELTEIGADNVTEGRRMVSFEGDLRMLYKANLHCRTALRILKPIYHFNAGDTDQLYAEVRSFEWDTIFSVDRTFTIDAVIFSDEFKHSKFVSYRVKDAIVDYFVAKHGKRPSVKISNPDIYINVHIAQTSCTISLDSSGESLHKRGYRVEQTEAPLNEVLAAGMILKTGWRGESDFMDPMCGSGTLPIEAALIANNIAPGVFRDGFAFEKWNDFDQDMFDDIYNDDSAERPFAHTIYGSDISSRAIEVSQKNIKGASMNKYIQLEVKQFQQIENPPAGILIVTNPPYGERIAPSDLLGLYETIGERLKHHFQGSKAWILSYKTECFEKISLKPAERIFLMNGGLACEFRQYDIFDGKFKEYKRDLVERGEFRERSEKKPSYGKKGDKPFTPKSVSKGKPYAFSPKGGGRPASSGRPGDGKSRPGGSRSSNH